jgi:hypothetical protein
MDKLDKIKLLFYSMNSNKNTRIDREFSYWNNIYFNIRIIINKDNFQNIKKSFELYFNQLIYFENINREDGYTMKVRGKIVSLYNCTNLDEELEEFINEIITNNDSLIELIGENIESCLGNKNNYNIRLFSPNNFIFDKNILQLDMHLFIEILNNYLHRCIVNYKNNSIDENNWLNMKIKIEKEKLKIEEIIYRYSNILNILKNIENLLLNDDEYKKSYLLKNNNTDKKKKKNLLTLLKKIYITKKYKDDTLLNKLNYNKDNIKKLENIINSIIININDFIHKIRNLLNHNGESKKEKKCFSCFSFSTKIDPHKIYSELSSFI